MTEQTQHVGAGNSLGCGHGEVLVGQQAAAHNAVGEQLDAAVRTKLRHPIPWTPVQQAVLHLHRITKGAAVPVTASKTSKTVFAGAMTDASRSWSDECLGSLPGC